MLDVVAIVVAVISLVASVLTAGITSWLTYNLDKRKSIREAEKLLRKYQDPLVLAARDLQARLYNIVRGGILHFADGTPEQNDTLFIYTAFLVGQYFAWIHILRRQGQFIAFTSGGKQRSRSQNFIRITDQITDLLNTDVLEPGISGGDREQWETERWDVEQQAGLWREAERWDAERLDPEGLFVLWKDHQRAIGEIMTTRDERSDELICTEFSEFTKRWKDEDPTLHTWLRAIPKAIRKLVADIHPASIPREGRYTREGRYAREVENRLWNTVGVEDSLELQSAVEARNPSDAENPPEVENTPEFEDTIEASQRAQRVRKARKARIAYDLKIRLVRLQRLLVDLVMLLDEEGLGRAGEKWKLKEEDIPKSSRQQP
ncbi:hypothetical protein B0J13DRAFT_636391 [Dactylonectria estremocensis]|uniref:Uncharacterized protein n=1 Tax=Dactylonectria estremocensis TaxID=1079267 RepID=A0A9P9ERD5_9HYPO|nr:hypothetical protein B0J13DRAFT_636391 [Dactylonectria estremocensis]